jgi:branched-chain amino acid transport system substrate-binding protein
MILKRFVTTVAGLAVTLALAGAVQAADPIQIGFSHSKTGYAAQAWPSQGNAYTLWREQVNAKGGLLLPDGTRRKIELVTYDDKSDPAEVVRVYEKLIVGDKVDLIMAPWGTPFHFALAGLVERYKFPLVGNTAASVKIREFKPGYIWFVTAMFPDLIAEELAKMMKQLGIKTVAVNTLQSDFALEVKTFVVPALKKNGFEIVVENNYPHGIKDMTAMLLKVKQANPDAVLSFSYPPDSVLYVNQAREIGINSKFQLVLSPTRSIPRSPTCPAKYSSKRWPRRVSTAKSCAKPLRARPSTRSTARSNSRAWRTRSRRLASFSFRRMERR